MRKNAQSTMEFTFVLIVIFFMVYGLIRVFRWGGMDLAERRWAHDTTLSNESLPMENRLAPDFYRPKRINSVFRGTSQ
jgi:hypothetical protein